MNNDFQNIFYMMRSVRLSGHEKRTMRAAILRRAGIAQMRACAVGARPSIFGIELRRRTIVAGSMIGALLFGSTMSYASEGALPGDVLYPVKVSVNERVREALAQSNKDKAALETRFVARRLEETERLALQGRLSTTTQVALEERMAKHIAKAEDYNARVEDEGDTVESDELESDREATLDAHHEVLNTLAQREQNTEVKEKMTRLAGSLNARATQGESTRTGRKSDAISDGVRGEKNGNDATSTAIIDTARSVKKEKQSARKKQYIEKLEKKLNISVPAEGTSEAAQLSEEEVDTQKVIRSRSEGEQEKSDGHSDDATEQNNVPEDIKTENSSSGSTQEGRDEGESNR